MTYYDLLWRFMTYYDLFCPQVRPSSVGSYSRRSSWCYQGGGDQTLVSENSHSDHHLMAIITIVITDPFKGLFTVYNIIGVFVICTICRWKPLRNKRSNYCCLRIHWLSFSFFGRLMPMRRLLTPEQNIKAGQQRSFASFKSSGNQPVCSKL